MADWTNVRLICDATSVVKLKENVNYLDLQIVRPETRYVLEPKKHELSFHDNKTEILSFSHVLSPIGLEDTYFCNTTETYLDTPIIACWALVEKHLMNSQVFEIAKFRTNWIYSKKGSVSAGMQAAHLNEQVPVKATVWPRAIGEVGKCTRF